MVGFYNHHNIYSNLQNIAALERDIPVGSRAASLARIRLPRLLRLINLRGCECIDSQGFAGAAMETIVERISHAVRDEDSPRSVVVFVNEKRKLARGLRVSTSNAACVSAAGAANCVRKSFTLGTPTASCCSSGKCAFRIR